MGTKKCVEFGFGYGESEYEVSFGLAPRNGELPPSVPKTPEPFNSPFPARDPERSADSNSLQIWGPGHIYPEIESQWLKKFFENGEWRN